MPSNAPNICRQGWVRCFVGEEFWDDVLLICAGCGSMLMVILSAAIALIGEFLERGSNDDRPIIPEEH